MIAFMVGRSTPSIITLRNALRLRCRRAMRRVIIDGVDRPTMKAIIRDTYGSADILELREIDKPEIGDDEVLVRVHAAGVDQGVWHVMTGLPYPIRFAGYGLRAP